MKLLRFLFPFTENPRPVGSSIFRIAVLLFLAWYGLPFFTKSIIELGQYSEFLHGPNLIFHEAGHMIFGLFGSELLMFLGGSLFQCLFPLIIGFAFLLKNKDTAGSSIFFWWTGQNLVDVSPYINDARMLQLQLLGGGNGREVEGHDWLNILTRLDMLGSDIYIARWVLLIGRTLMVLALVWGIANASLSLWISKQSQVDD